MVDDVVIDVYREEKTALMKPQGMLISLIYGSLKR